MRIYRNRWHIAVTFSLIVVPFCYLLIFTWAAHLSPGALVSETLVSIGRIAVAYVIAIVIAWPLAVFFYRGRRATVALPFFDVLNSLPTSAALPLAALVLGPSTTTVILFLVVEITWPMLFSIVSSLKLIREDWQDAVRIAGLKRWEYVRLFLWPASMSGVVTGSIVGLGDGWQALIATELIVRARGGLGVFFAAHADSYQLTLLGIFGLLLIIFAINKLIWLPLLEHSHRQLEG